MNQTFPNAALIVRRRSVATWIAVAVIAGACCPAASHEPPARPLILAHYMPWYAAKPYGGAWGWHWTMNTFDPDTQVDGKPHIASHYRPIIGPYDSGDPVVLEYHLLLMKVAGIDGVIVDWFGLTDHFDYAALHRNAAAIVQAAARLGLQFAVCYEDRTIPTLEAAGRLSPDGRVPHARREIDWLRKTWFTESHYVRLGERPLFLSFGTDGLTDEEWARALQGLAAELVYVSEHRKRPVASGAFDWPIPREYPASLDRFATEAARSNPAIPVAFPRFHDIYAEGRAGATLGRIPDDDGRTWTSTLTRALEGRPAVVQLATWNDWGEGTGIEPTEEFGYRDLEAVQQLRRDQVDAAFPCSASDLRLPLRLVLERRRAGSAERTSVLDRVALLISQQRCEAAGTLLDGLSGPEAVSYTHLTLPTKA